MADNYVECKNVNYKYVNSESAKNVLDDATLSVEKGSFTAIIGRNGSGKSTLAKCLNSLLVPDSGMVMVAGIIPKNDDDVLKIQFSIFFDDVLNKLSGFFFIDIQNTCIFHTPLIYQT